MNNIGLGTAAIGRPIYINIRHEKPGADVSLPVFKKNGISILDAAYDQGVRFFDASPGYGLAESLLIEWLQEKNDPDITIATKWGLSYAANFDMHATVHEIKEHSLEKLNAQWEFSKKLLPNLKIYQVHSATFATGVLENKAILHRLHELKKEYNIIIGLTSTGADQMEVVKKAADTVIENEPLFGSFQCTFNIMEQSVSALKAIFAATNRQLIIKESLANGRLIPSPSSREHDGLYRYITQLADKYRVGTDAIAIRFCLDSFPEAVTLSGASSINQVQSNLAANNFILEREEMELLKSYKIDPAMYWDERKQLSWQ